MPRWNLSKAENKQHNQDDTETTTYEATIRLDADDPAEPVTLGDIGTLVGALTTVDGIPEAALLGNSIDVALRWTDADLEP